MVERRREVGVRRAAIAAVSPQILVGEPVIEGSSEFKALPSEV